MHLRSLVGSPALWLALALGSGAAGCIGRIGDGAGGTEGTGGPGQTPAGAACAGLAPDTEPVMVRMLNRREYRNTVRDLLGVEVDVTDAFPADPIVGFDNNAASLVASSLLVEKQLDVAEEVVAEVDVAALLPCTSADACIDDFLAAFGRRAFRRPPAEGELAPLRAIYDAARGAGRSEDAALRLVLVGMLLSPQFLYRAETTASETGGVVAAEPYELASRLSYFLWASMPDDALLDAAESGALGEPAELDAQARRMLDDPRAREVTAAFHTLWLELYKLSGVQKDADLFPDFAALAPAFEEETRRFAEHVFWEEDGGVRAYLLSDSGFVDAQLAAHYGLPAPDGQGFAQIATEGSERFGLLTQGSVLSATSNPDRTSPTRRGKFVRAQLLCQPPPPPPADVPPLEIGSDSGGTLREQLAAHVDNPACQGCHQLLDPVGFGLEAYDAIGAFRSEEGGAAVDVSGELSSVTPGAGPFQGARELSEKLAGSEELQACVVAQWFRFAAGRDAGDADACSLATIEDGLRAGGGQLPELLVAIATSPAVLLKSTEPSP